MSFFVNLPLSWVWREPVWLQRLLENSAKAGASSGFGPEFGLDAESLALPAAWHRSIAAQISGLGLRCSIHLPFFMPAPGSPTLAQRRQSAATLRKAVDLANLYSPHHLVGHPDFNRTAPFPAAAETETGADWLEASASIWADLAALSTAPLYLENTYEQGPAAIIALLEYMREHHQAKAGMCFDIGHWFSFAGGARLRNLEDWLDLIAPWLRHLHLHDNDGSGDQHIGLGCGGIDLKAFFTSLRRRGLNCTFTLEPHDLESFAASLAWLEANPELMRPRPEKA